MEYKIIWQKWMDPFGGDDPEFDDILDQVYNDYELEEDTNTQETKKEIPKMSKIRVMATPMGIIPVNENTCSSKIFNFWVGHTNFNITKNIAKIIEETSGVESLDIFTRYRFRISVGKAFDDSSIMRDINDNVYAYLE
jgi:hypothetical protein